MKPVSPVAIEPELRWGVCEITYAKDQRQYIPLPALHFSDGVVVSRWKPSLRERLAFLFGGSLYLAVWTFNRGLPPVKLSTNIQEICGPPR